MEREKPVVFETKLHDDQVKTLNIAKYDVLQRMGGYQIKNTMLAVDA